MHVSYKNYRRTSILGTTWPMVPLINSDFQKVSLIWTSEFEIFENFKVFRRYTFIRMFRAECADIVDLQKFHQILFKALEIEPVFEW